MDRKSPDPKPAISPGLNEPPAGSRPRRESESPIGVDTTALVRSLQRAEGQTTCFRTGLSDCDRIDCPWRIYCFDPPVSVGTITP